MANQRLHLSSQFRCKVDASWKALNEDGGYAWNLSTNDDALCIIASGRTNPLRTPLEAEAYALREAMTQLRLFGYSDVAYCTDSQQLVALLQQARARDQHYAQEDWTSHHIAPLLSSILDILAVNPS